MSRKRALMLLLAHTQQWLTLKRLRSHGAILALCLWSIYLWNISNSGLRDRSGNLKGTDFLHFYTLGILARQHDGADLYELDAQTRIAAERVPAADGLQYLPLYPPQVSIIFAPLARLQYFNALLWWWIISVAIYGSCCFLIWRQCPNLHSFAGTTILLAIAFPAFFHLIAWGQTSGIALLCFTAMYFALRSRSDFVAGLSAGCLIFKPQLGLAIAVVALSCGMWKLLLGGFVSGFAQLAIGVGYYGWEPLRRWLQVLLNARSVIAQLEPKPYQTHCLRTFWTMLVPWQILAFLLYLVSAGGVLYLVVICWKNKLPPLSVKFAALLLATVLVAPHLTVYDLVILAPALLLMSDWILARQTRSALRMGMLLYFVVMLPLVGPLAQWTHLQLSVVAMTALLYLIWKHSRTDGPATSARMLVR